MKKTLGLLLMFIVVLHASNDMNAQGYLKTNGKKIVNGNGENIILRGIGLGGWMLQEPYMLQLSKVAIAQYDIKAKITDLIGQKNCENFYSSWLENMVTEKDIDSLKAWGFNSIRLPMHYNLFTLPVEKEPVQGRDTWLKTGFELTDRLLSWCRKNRMYLILDLHAAPGGQGNDKPIADVDTTKSRLWESNYNQLKTIALWRKLAERYANEEWIGGYDLINETNYPMEGNEPLRKLVHDITRAIRLEDNNHIIFIEGNQFANDYTGLTPPWDANMAYSFHKYWNAPSIETIQKYLDLREEFNTPLWMGESGENNNEWYRSVIDLLEGNNIGWAWWTLKKIGSGSGIMNVTRPEGYQKVIDYWAGKGPKPAENDALAIFRELSENVKIERCKINYDVLRALFGK